MGRNSGASSSRSGLDLLPLWPGELGDRTLEGRKNLLAVIERELRRERRRGFAGHAAYDVARHAKLVRLLREERQSLTAVELSLCGRHRSAGLPGASR